MKLSTSNSQYGLMDGTKQSRFPKRQLEPTDGSGVLPTNQLNQEMNLLENNTFSVLKDGETGNPLVN